MRLLDRPASRVYTGANLRQLIEERTGDRDLARDAAVVSAVLPFKVNSYVVDELVDWTRAPDDPVYRLLFPHRDMLDPVDFERLARVHDLGPGFREQAVQEIRAGLNPHPSSQIELNTPMDGTGWGLQHKYRESLLVFPRQGQTCHSYCGYCFRWAQFVGSAELKMAVAGPETMLSYLDRTPSVTDVIITGGDPLVMSNALLESYLRPLLGPGYEQVETIRIGTKAVSFQPDRITTGPEGDGLLALLSDLVAAGKHVALMLHVSHPRELRTDRARLAVARLRETGATLRSQAPVVRHVNDDEQTWAEMWREQVALGISPYYYFVERDTGSRRYYGLPLQRAFEVYRNAFTRVSGLARTARGPVMSAAPGKVVIDGVVELGGERAFALRFLQARDEKLVGRPFHAAFDPDAQWWDELRPHGPGDRPFFDRTAPVPDTP